MKKFTSTLIFACLSLFSQAQIITDTLNSADSLADILVGTGTNITNVTMTCGDSGVGYFLDGLSTNIGIDNGIVLTTGSCLTISGPPSTTISSNGTGYNANDPSLDTLAGFPTHDKCVLEFDVTVVGNMLSLDYVFGSEEYPEFQCSAFNDIFAFFLSGPIPGGGTYNNHNIALVPNTTIPVSINTVNDTTLSSAPCGVNNGIYYVNNTDTTIVYDGFTVPLTASASTVPGSVYHMKFAVADASDQILDSGVFLAANSLKSWFDAPESIQNLMAKQYFDVFPNPAKETLNIKNKQLKTINYSIINMLGNVVLKGNSQTDITLNISTLPAGFYQTIVEVDGKRFINKVAVK
jgi:hypothetical protein